MASLSKAIWIRETSSGNGSETMLLEDAVHVNAARMMMIATQRATTAARSQAAPLTVSHTTITTT
jgi:hypothetical protein